MSESEPAPPSAALPTARKWAITVSVMLITVTQMLDTSTWSPARAPARAQPSPAPAD